MALHRVKCSNCGAEMNVRSSSHNTIQKCKGCGSPAFVNVSQNAGCATALLGFIVVTLICGGISSLFKTGETVESVPKPQIKESNITVNPTPIVNRSSNEFPASLPSSPKSRATQKSTNYYPKTLLPVTVEPDLKALLATAQLNLVKAQQELADLKLTIIEGLKKSSEYKSAISEVARLDILIKEERSRNAPREETSRLWAQAKGRVNKLEIDAQDRNSLIVLAKKKVEQYAREIDSLNGQIAAKNAQSHKHTETPTTTVEPNDPPPPVNPAHSSSSGTHVGPRGGVYHISKSGKKVYEKK